MTVSARAIHNLHLGTTKIGKRYSLGQAPKSAMLLISWLIIRCALRIKLASIYSRQCVKIISDKKTLQKRSSFMGSVYVSTSAQNT